MITKSTTKYNQIKNTAESTMTSNQINFINHDSDSDYAPKQINSSTATPVMNNIQQFFSPTPSKSSSLPSNVDVLNHDHPHQYD